MGRNRSKRRQTRASASAEHQAKPQTAPPPEGPSAVEVAELAVDLWRVSSRARTDSTGERIVAACERAQDRLKRIGFEIDAMVGRGYDTNMKAKVVDHEPSEGPLVVGQCISPAVFYRGRLVREAEIVTKGGEEAK